MPRPRRRRRDGVPRRRRRGQRRGARQRCGRRWLDELAVTGTPAIGLPVAVRAVVAQTRHVGERGDTVATARVRTRRGTWVVVRGSVVGDDRIAVLIEPARPAENAAAIADAYGLTDRERMITEQVARGVLHERDRRSPPPLGVHGAGPPEVDLREVRHQLPWCPRLPAVLRPPPPALLGPSGGAAPPHDDGA